MTPLTRQLISLLVFCNVSVIAISFGAACVDAGIAFGCNRQKLRKRLRGLLCRHRKRGGSGRVFDKVVPITNDEDEEDTDVEKRSNELVGALAESGVHRPS